MKNGEQINLVLIHTSADSLHSLIADGEYRSTSLLGSNDTMQINCNKEGFNAFVIIVLILELKQASLLMSVLRAENVISGSDLAQEDNTMTVIRVETRLHVGGVHT